MLLYLHIQVKQLHFVIQLKMIINIGILNYMEKADGKY